MKLKEKCLNCCKDLTLKEIDDSCEDNYLCDKCFQELEEKIILDEEDLKDIKNDIKMDERKIGLL